MAQDWGKILKYTAVLAGGFIAVRVALKVKDKVDQGAKVATAVAEEVTKIVTQDLNPASDKNLLYSGPVEKATTWILDRIGPDAVNQMNHEAELRQAQLDKSAKAQDNFRASEIRAENAEGAKSQAADNQMAKAQENFRTLEYGTDTAISERAIFGLFPKAF